MAPRVALAHTVPPSTPSETRFALFSAQVPLVVAYEPVSAVQEPADEANAIGSGARGKLVPAAPGDTRAWALTRARR
jgi:hypothetical protein